MYSFEKLRKDYTEFLYKDYIIEELDNRLRITYNFEIPGLSEFKPYWEFDVSSNYNKELLDELAFLLGMVELISYWKCVCPKKVKIMCKGLDKWQAEWWKKLYYNGLGEFFYVNKIKIDIDNLMDIEVKNEKRFISDNENYNGAIVPIGGGKDSVVSLEIVKKTDVDFVTYSVNRINAVKEVVEICTEKSGDIIAKRVLSRQLLDLNAKGYLNGHTPFSAIVAFSSYIAAILNKRKYIILSNETSANESTVRNSNVNHQYSKSYEFERDFVNYINTVTDADIHYFSLLRPISELQIAKLFSRAKKYHKAFRSCNAGSKKGIWCCECPKCLFVYIILSPFLTDMELKEIFGENLLNKPSMEKYLRELSGIDENKPFECVGTRLEVMAALKNFVVNGRESMLTEKYKEVILNSFDEFNNIINSYTSENNVPEKFLKELKTSLNL